MDIDLNNIDFAIAVNTFHDDIQDKLQILSKMQLQFLRKFQHRVKISQHHSQMIFQIRKIVSNIEEMYKDIKDYFTEMKVQFVYDFVRKIQTLMVIGYNHLSQALLITFDMYQSQKKKQKENKDAVTCSCKAKNDYIISKDELKRLQHIDYTITNIENEEERLLLQMQTIYDRMMMQKSLIQKVKPSLASKQLEEMKDHIQTVMENNQRLFEETYMMKFFQFHNHIKKLDKPEKITEVYHQMNNTLKQNFIKQALKAANRIQRGRRHNQENMASVEVQTQQLLRAKSRRDQNSNKQQNSSSLMKQTQSAHNSQFSLTKQRKLNEKLSIQINHLQKQNIALNDELSSYKFAEKQIEIKYREIVQKYQILQQMYKKSRQQMNDFKGGSEWTIEKLQIENRRLKRQISILKGRQFTQSGELIETSVQTDRIIRNQSKICALDKDIMYGIYVLEQKQTQTYEQYILPNNDNEIVKLLKNRNQKAIIMLNEKDKKIRQSSTKLGLLQDQTNKIKSNLNMFVGIIQQHFGGVKRQNILESNDPNLSINGIQNKSSSKKVSILQMNSLEIGIKIKQILKLIVPEQNKQWNLENSSNLNNKFKKLNEEQNFKNFNLSKNQTMMDQQIQNDLVGDLPSLSSPKNGIKTFSDLHPENLSQNKKRKRLSVFNILTAVRKNQISPMITKQDKQIQTQQKESKESNSINTKEFQTQTIIAQDGQNIIKIQKQIHRNSIQLKKQRPNYEKSVQKNKKRKRFVHSNRNSESALEGRHKKSQFFTDLNTFQKLKIGQTVQNRKMIQTSLSCRKDKFQCLNAENTMFEKKTKQLQLSPFKTKQDRNTGRFSSLLEDSMEIQTDKLASKYNSTEDNSNFKSSKSYIRSKGLMSSTVGTDINFFKNVVNQNNMLKKYKHKRLTSQMATTFRPISQVEQIDKSKQSIKVDFCPHNTYSGEGNIMKFSSGNKFTLTTNAQLKKQCSQSRSQNKKKTLLLSIQKYKPQHANMNDILLTKYLNKVIQKWGKQKVKQIVNVLTFSQTNQFS